MMIWMDICMSMFARDVPVYELQIVVIKAKRELGFDFEACHIYGRGLSPLLIDNRSMMCTKN